MKSARDLKYQDYFDPVDDLEEVPGDRKDPEDDQSEGEEEEIDHDDGSVEQYVLSLGHSPALLMQSVLKCLEAVKRK